ncbi:hypothetical protein MBLNU459_g0953t1, partial [Dothideomycetes sp. NU459]
MSDPTQNMQASVEEGQVDAAVEPQSPERSENAEI